MTSIHHFFLVGVLFLSSDVVFSAPPGFPNFSWDTLPVFFHAANQSGPLSEVALDIISRYPLVTIEKMQSQDQNPVATNAEEKIVAAAKQIKARNESIKVLFYLNSIMDWFMYDLHQYSQNHSKEMWWWDNNGRVISIRNQSIFDLRSPEVRQVWINVLTNATATGVIDGAFIDRGGLPASFPGFNISHDDYSDWVKGHDQMMVDAQRAMGEDKIAISNNKDFDGVNARMFERFFVKDFDHSSYLADLVAFTAESKVPRIAEAHGEPCTPQVFNLTLAAYLIGAGDYSYYACTDGWTTDAGWLRWYPEYSKPLGEPDGKAYPIGQSAGWCQDQEMTKTDKERQKGNYFKENLLWNDLKKIYEESGRSRKAVHHWLKEHSDIPLKDMPIFGRKFGAGTHAVCITLDLTQKVPRPCIVWGDGSVTGVDDCV